MAHELLDSTRRALDARAVAFQRASRVPGLAAGVAHRGKLLWDVGVGRADLNDPTVPLGPDTQYPVASNTKTFTAAMVMQLRDEGRLSLDDSIQTHLPDSEHPLTVRQLLAHASGIQREPMGEMWDTLEGPEPADTVANWNLAERVLAPRRAWHYSNLAYMVLGELVARLDSRPWEDSLRARLLDPLGLRRTTTTPQAPRAGLYYVPPFTDVPTPESIVFTGSTMPAGGLLSTVADLATWHAFLLDPDAAVLSPDSVEEMREPQMTGDPHWERGYGLGLYLLRRDNEIWFGHTGGAPGAITAAFSHADSGLTAVLLMNQGAAEKPGTRALDLANHVLEHDPPPQDPWVPGDTVPDDLAEITGLWFSEGAPLFFAVRRGRLEVRGARDADDVPPSVLVRESEDVYRTIAGSERGERLIIHRRDDGTVWQLNWATYRFTRDALSFAEPNPARPDRLPGA